MSSLPEPTCKLILTLISSKLGVNYWEPDSFVTNPPFSIIQIDDIRSHVGRQYLNINNCRVWGTITLDTVQNSYIY